MPLIFLRSKICQLRTKVIISLLNDFNPDAQTEHAWEIYSTNKITKVSKYFPMKPSKILIKNVYYSEC